MFNFTALLASIVNYLLNISFHFSNCILKNKYGLIDYAYSNFNLLFRLFYAPLMILVDGNIHVCHSVQKLGASVQSWSIWNNFVLFLKISISLLLILICVFLSTDCARMVRWFGLGTTELRLRYIYGSVRRCSCTSSTSVQLRVHNSGFGSFWPDDSC